jgi:hypothetical protein
VQTLGKGGRKERAKRRETREKTSDTIGQSIAKLQVNVQLSLSFIHPKTMNIYQV